MTLSKVRRLIVAISEQSRGKNRYQIGKKGKDLRKKEQGLIINRRERDEKEKAEAPVVSREHRLFGLERRARPGELTIQIHPVHR